MQSDDNDFEFERRFLVDELPVQLLEDSRPDVIVQTYFLADGGYGLRVRLQATRAQKTLPLTSLGKDPISLFEDDFDLCILTAKGPSVGGTRYEAERELDIGIGIEMCLRGGHTLSKRRHGVWLEEDGWVIDEFGGDNYPLTIAECERTSPVIDLAIPSFCVAEVTDDYRFSNDSLVVHPFGTWKAEVEDSFRQEFGTNSASAI